ncbi:MAG: deoxyribose-phosphate aldolase [Candidatus Eisenbacteria bacterium]|nr:deoxyribose-phosphate aldolase [Candidatus Eisenbacteria bacterium]
MRHDPKPQSGGDAVSHAPLPESWVQQIVEEVTRRLDRASSPGSSAATSPPPPAGCTCGGARPATCSCGAGSSCGGGCGATPSFRCAGCPDSGACLRDCPDRQRLIEELGIARLGCGPGIGAVDARVAAMLDHTLLRPDATRREILALCEEAHCHGFASVCVQPMWVPVAARALEGSRAKVCTVIGFPHGANRAEVKAYETRVAVAQGAREVDMVIPIGALKDGDLRTVREHIGAVVRATRAGVITKVILETSFLTREEKIAACAIAKEERADFVKTSTGFASAGATLEDVRLMRETVGPAMGVKAAGGIRDAALARAMVEAGATRIGASASVKIAAGGGDSTGRY